MMLAVKYFNNLILPLFGHKVPGLQELINLSIVVFSANIHNWSPLMDPMINLIAEYRLIPYLTIQLIHPATFWWCFIMALLGHWRNSILRVCWHCLGGHPLLHTHFNCFIITFQSPRIWELPAFLSSEFGWSHCYHRNKSMSCLNNLFPSPFYVTLVENNFTFQSKGWWNDC